MGIFGLSKSNVEKLKVKRDVSGLVEAMNYKKDPQVAWAAMAALVEIGPLSLPALRQCLQYGADPLARKLAAIGLGQFGDTTATGALKGMLDDPHPLLKKFAAIGLCNCRDPAGLGYLTQRLVDPGEPVEMKKAIIQVVAYLGTGESANALAQAAVRGGDIGEEAFAALGRLGEEKAVAALLPLLRDTQFRSPYPRSAAVYLQRLGWKPGADRDGVAYLIALERWDDCVGLGAPAVQPLTIMLQFEAPVAPDKIAWLLGRIGDSKAATPLINKLNNPVWRPAVSRALAAIGMPAVPSLINALDKDYIAQPVVDVLVGLGQPSIPPLIIALGDSNLQRATRAADALDRLGWQPDDGTIGATYWIVRRQWDKCVALGTVAVSPLISELKCRGSDKNHAFAALETIGWRPGNDADSVYYWLAKDDTGKCIEIGEAAIEPLMWCIDRARGSGRTASHLYEALGILGGRLSGSSQAKIVDYLKSSSELSALFALYEQTKDAALLRDIIATSLKFISDENEYAKVSRRFQRTCFIGLLDKAVPLLGDPVLHSASVLALEENLRHLSENTYNRDSYQERIALIRALGNIGFDQENEELRKAVVLGMKKDLAAEQFEVRKAAAQALVTIYRRGDVNEALKQVILTAREQIIRPHIDIIKDTGRSSDCTQTHTDEGIGVDFPL